METENKPAAEEPKQIEIDVPTTVSGNVKFMTKAAFTNPAPDKLIRVLAAVKYTLVSIITAVSATDLFSGRQSKIISFTLGIAYIVCGAIEFATGVKPITDEKKQ